MQIIYKNENTEGNGKRAYLMGVIIYIRRISRCLEGKYVGRSRGRILEYKSVREFLVDIKKEFERGDEKLVKVVELKKLEQEGKTMEEFV